MLLDLIRAQGVEGATVLDIGGGIGVIDHELLRAGASRATLADASAASVAVAREAAAAEAGLSDRMTFLEGDAVLRADEIDGADVVTLDRVICCYPDVTSLVSLLGRPGGAAVRDRAAAGPLDRARRPGARGVSGIRLLRKRYRPYRPSEPRGRRAGRRPGTGAAGRDRHLLLARGALQALHGRRHEGLSLMELVTGHA